MNKNTENMKRQMYVETSALIDPKKDAEYYTNAGIIEFSNGLWRTTKSVRFWLKPIDQPTASKVSSKVIDDLWADYSMTDELGECMAKTAFIEAINTFALSQQQPTLDLEKVLTDEFLDSLYNEMTHTGLLKTEFFNRIKSRLSSLPQASQQQNSEKEAVGLLARVEEFNAWLKKIIAYYENTHGEHAKIQLSHFKNVQSELELLIPDKIFKSETQKKD